MEGGSEAVGGEGMDWGVAWEAERVVGGWIGSSGGVVRALRGLRMAVGLAGRRRERRRRARCIMAEVMLVSNGTSTTKTNTSRSG